MEALTFEDAESIFDNLNKAVVSIPDKLLLFPEDPSHFYTHGIVFDLND